MPKATFVYVTYIAARPEAVWRALLDGEFTRQYWEHDNVSDWKRGSPWEHRRLDADRTVDLLGEVLEAEPPQRLVDMQRKITEGWPRVLSSFKSLLETGRPLKTWA